MVNEAKQRMTIEATSKENDYSTHSVNYFQSWQMGTTNKLPKKHYANECTAADNLKQLSLPIVIQWVKTSWD